MRRTPDGLQGPGSTAVGATDIEALGKWVRALRSPGRQIIADVDAMDRFAELLTRNARLRTALGYIVENARLAALVEGQRRQALENIAEYAEKILSEDRNGNDDYLSTVVEASRHILRREPYRGWIVVSLSFTPVLQVTFRNGSRIVSVESDAPVGQRVVEAWSAAKESFREHTS